MYGKAVPHHTPQPDLMWDTTQRAPHKSQFSLTFDPTPLWLNNILLIALNSDLGRPMMTGYREHASLEDCLFWSHLHHRSFAHPLKMSNNFHLITAYWGYQVLQLITSHCRLLPQEIHLVLGTEHISLDHNSSKLPLAMIQGFLGFIPLYPRPTPLKTEQLTFVVMSQFNIRNKTGNVARLETQQKSKTLGRDLWFIRSSCLLFRHLFALISSIDIVGSSFKARLHPEGCSRIKYFVSNLNFIYRTFIPTWFCFNSLSSQRFCPLPVTCRKKSVLTQWTNLLLQNKKKKKIRLTHEIKLLEYRKDKILNFPEKETQEKKKSKKKKATQNVWFA